MKTRLLLLFALMFSALGFSQMQFSNLTSSAITRTTATLSVDLANVCSGSNYRMQYSTSDTFLAGTIDSGHQTNNTSGTKNHPITGLLPNTQYFFRYYSSPNQGCGNTSQITSTIASFTTLPDPAIAEYNFNNTRNNVNFTQPFATGTTTFVADRNGNASSALRIPSSGISSSIVGLPNGTAARSVSIWYKVSAAALDNCLFVYGIGGGNNAYGVSFNDSNTWFNFAWSTNTPITNPSNDGQWHHLVTSFDSSRISRVYIDGVLKTTLLQNSWFTANSTNFWLGGLFTASAAPFDGTVDDLKIYNYALSQTEITNLFNNNTLTTTDFNQNDLKVSLYPNPATDILNIEMTNEIKSIEIYNIQGQKVMSSNQKQINVSDLASGMYMIRIQDNENGIATKKFVKK